MRIILRLLCVLSLLAPCLACADPTMIFLVRHGEKEASGKDPALTAQGQARAQNIATILPKAGIGHVKHILGGHVAVGCIVRTTAEVLLALLPDHEFRRQLDAAGSGFRELVVRPRSTEP